jgi:hypothetical protein
MQQYPSRYYSNATQDLTCHNIYFILRQYFVQINSPHTKNFRPPEDQQRPPWRRAPQFRNLWHKKKHNTSVKSRTTGIYTQNWTFI